MTRFNLSQRIVLVTGWGLALAVVGRWATQLGQMVERLPVRVGAGAFTFGGLHPWVQMGVWLLLVVLWTAGSAWVLRTPRQGQ